MRLKILSGDEIDTLYGRPRFTHEERVEHFALSPTEGTALEQLNSTSPTLVEVLLCLDGWLPYILRASLGCWRVAQNRDVQEALRP